MNKFEAMHRLECMELAELNARIEKRKMQERMERLEAVAMESERRRREEAARHDEEVKTIVYGVSAFSCLFTAVACFFTAPWWTAVAPIIFGIFILRKAGW